MDRPSNKIGYVLGTEVLQNLIHRSQNNVL